MKLGTQIALSVSLGVLAAFIVVIMFVLHINGVY
jgi:hypothetical protein